MQMKQSVRWIVVAGVMSVFLVLALQAQEREAEQLAREEGIQDGTVIFRFSNKADMQEFAKQWQQRQGILTRISMLEAYWNREQALLGQADQGLLASYKLDIRKDYTLDRERRVLIERSAPAAEVPTAQPLTPGETPSPTAP